MSEEFSLSDIDPELAVTVPTAAQVDSGIPIPPVRLLEVLSPDDWERFTEEWLTYHKKQGSYQAIRRYSGPGDLGLDVVAFTSKEGFAEPWDSYQCKHYDHPLTPEDVCGEVAKIIYYSFQSVTSIQPRPAGFLTVMFSCHPEVLGSPLGGGLGTRGNSRMR